MLALQGQGGGARALGNTLINRIARTGSTWVAPPTLPPGSLLVPLWYHPLCPPGSHLGDDLSEAQLYSVDVVVSKGCKRREQMAKGTTR